MLKLGGLIMTTAEAARVRAVQALGVMGSAPDPDFDRLARLAGHIAHATYAHVCFIDGTHQFIKAIEGGDFPRLVPHEASVCAEAVQTQSPLIIPDLRIDHRHLCRDLYERYGFSSYASVPVRLPNSHVVGAVAVMSRGDLSLSDRQIAALEECADLAGREALIKRAGAQPRSMGGSPAGGPKAHDTLRAIMTSHIKVLRAVSDGVIVVRADGSINFTNAAAERMLGRLPGSLLDAAFEDEVLHPDGRNDPSKGGSPVLATLGDGAERLVRSAPFRRKQGDAVRVGYVVSPILTDARAIGAVVVFRALEKGEFSNGVDLRNTLREVAKLKEQLAKAEAAQRSVAAVPPRPLPPLSSRPPVDFAHLLEAIREERAGQSVRAQTTITEGLDGFRNSTPLLGSGVEWSTPKALSGSSTGLSRTERWLASALN